LSCAPYKGYLWRPNNT